MRPALGRRRHAERNDPSSRIRGAGPHGGGGADERVAKVAVRAADVVYVGADGYLGEYEEKFGHLGSILVSPDTSPSAASDGLNFMKVGYRDRSP